MNLIAIWSKYNVAKQAVMVLAQECKADLRKLIANTDKWIEAKDEIRLACQYEAMPKKAKAAFNQRLAQFRGDCLPWLTPIKKGAAVNSHNKGSKAETAEAQESEADIPAVSKKRITKPEEQVAAVRSVVQGLAIAFDCEISEVVELINKTFVFKK